MLTSREERVFHLVRMFTKIITFHSLSEMIYFHPLY